MGLIGRRSKARQAELEELRRQIRELNERITDLATDGRSNATRFDDVDRRIGTVEGRVTQIGSEVTHQLGELSGDIDALGSRTDALVENIANLTALPQSVDQVRSDQARLANEQARYEIAFRQDLAELADMMAKRRTS